MVTLASGSVIAQRYELRSVLGRGGMGTVWTAEHVALKSPVAVKFLDPLVVQDQGILERFLREARAAAALRSVHVVQIFDYGVFEETPYIAMELLRGESLRERIDRVQRLSPQETAKIINHISRAIGKAHEAGIVHRDLKPENVFIVNDDDEVVKVLDFGIAKVTQSELVGTSSSNTKTGSLLGTPYYMSPEQARGNRVVDARSDLWALAVIAFECLTGKTPFQSNALGDLILQICTKEPIVPSAMAPVPSGFDAWFARGVAKEPDARFQSAKELADSFGHLVGYLSGGGASTGGSTAVAFPLRALDGAPTSRESQATGPARSPSYDGASSVASASEGAPKTDVSPRYDSTHRLEPARSEPLEGFDTSRPLEPRLVTPKPVDAPGALQLTTGAISSVELPVHRYGRGVAWGLLALLLLAGGVAGAWALLRTATPNAAAFPPASAHQELPVAAPSETTVPAPAPSQQTSTFPRAVAAESASSNAPVTSAPTAAPSAPATSPRNRKPSEKAIGNPSSPASKPTLAAKPSTATTSRPPPSTTPSAPPAPKPESKPATPSGTDLFQERQW